ncbi:MAG TPA: MFS transporter [Solirubrobacteraceae bacterium]|nr:MFS transporter [Solirubrobacteraceae bacterium]
MSAGVQTGTIRTNIPARLDRLPWSRFHWLVVLGLGTVWILDGFEVTVVGTIGGRLTEPGSGISISTSQIGTAGAIYVIGACLGALFFGQLTDRFGRKKLFMITLALYLAATAATAFSFAPWYFFLCRFFTGAGIGGEYAAINSAIDELIPARMRGRVDLTINGSFWVGSIIASALAMVFLDSSIFAGNLGWRLEFAVGVIMAFSIMLVRRHVPESPRWLFIHGQEEEAERIVSEIERDTEEYTGEQLDQPDKSIEVRQRQTIPFRQIARVAFTLYPKRAVLGLALFIGQAFIYNGITFNLGTLFTTFFGVSSGFVPVFIIIYGVGNFLGPLTLGRLFDTVGRKPMITAMYLGSALVTVPMALVFNNQLVGEWGFMAFVFVTFFLASAGASAAYLTVSEIFPMETRALAIAFFYAVGTAAGGIAGPLLFGHLIGSGERSQVMIAFLIGAAVMAMGGIAELFLGVRAERAQLEDIAKPLTVEEAEQERGAEAAGTGAGGEGAEEELDPHRREALQARGEAEESRARAAEHRAAIHELRAQAVDGDQPARDRIAIEERLAEIAELHAHALDERAAACDERASAQDGDEAAAERARAAQQRAEGYAERARALGATDDEEAARHQALAEAAGERARAREQRALAQQALADAESDGDGEEAATVARARAEMHEQWAAMHEARGRAHEHGADGDEDAAAIEEREAARNEQLALAAEQQVLAAEHRVAAGEAEGARDAADDIERRRAEAAERERRAREFEQRVRARIDRRQQRERHGLRRFRPGPASTARPAWMASGPTVPTDADLDREIEVIARALDEHGPTDRGELARLVGARYWGPGRFRVALREAVEEGRARRVSRSTFAPPEDQDRSSV